MLWDTCKYIHKMERRLKELPHECEYESLIYERGTYFAFLQSMLETMRPVIGGLFVGLAFKAGRRYPKECRQVRLDVDRKLTAAIEQW